MLTAKFLRAFRWAIKSERMQTSGRCARSPAARARWLRFQHLIVCSRYHSRSNDPPSPCQTRAKKKYVRAVFILRHPSGHRVPNVLITWNQPDRRSDRDIVEDLEPILVLDSRCGSGELLEVIFQRLTDSIVIDSQPKTVIGPVVREAIGEQRYVRIAGDSVGFLWGISDTSEQT